MADATTTTRPVRTRKAAAPKAAAKAAPAKAAPAAAPADDEAGERYVVEFEHVTDTKSYAKWAPKAGNGCVGNVYVPIGTTRVRMLIIGPAAE